MVAARIPRAVRPADSDRARWLPDTVDHLLLVVALWPDERGRAAWEALRPNFVLDDITFDQHRLIPLVHRSLSALGVDDPDFGRMKGIRKNTWYQTHRFFNRVEHVLHHLLNATGRVLVLKGVPLALDYYDNPGLRPMSDMDVLVPFARVRDALQALDDLGFRSSPTDPRTFPLYKHGFFTEHADGTQVDLHWQTHRWLGLRGAPSAWGAGFWDAGLRDDDQWTRAEALTVGNAVCEAPCAEDLLLHVCVHAASSRGLIPLRWAADAATIIRRRPDLRWHALVERSLDRHVAPRVAEALGYLNDELHVAVPAAPLAALRAARPTLRERVADTTRTGPPRRPGVRGSGAHWASITIQESPTGALMSIPKYVTIVSEADHVWQVPLTLPRRMVKITRSQARRTAGAQESASADTGRYCRPTSRRGQ